MLGLTDQILEKLPNSVNDVFLVPHIVIKELLNVVETSMDPHQFALAMDTLAKLEQSNSPNLVFQAHDEANVCYQFGRLRENASFSEKIISTHDFLKWDGKVTRLMCLDQTVQIAANNLEIDVVNIQEIE